MSYSQVITVHLLTTSADDLSFTGAWARIEVFSHQCQWLPGGYDLEIGHLKKWLVWWLPSGYWPFSAVHNSSYNLQQYWYCTQMVLHRSGQQMANNMLIQQQSAAAFQMTIKWASKWPVAHNNAQVTSASDKYSSRRLMDSYIVLNLKDRCGTFVKWFWWNNKSF